MLIGAAIGFILWAILILLVVITEQGKIDLDWAKVGLLLLIMMGSGTAIGLIISKI